MDQDPDQGHHRASSTSRANGHAPLYRLNSNQSSTSIFEEVEMAHDELFSGPMAESLPTSVSAFSHRRPRADSTTSFAYYQDEDDLEPSPTFDEERRSMSDVGDFTFGEDDESNLDIESGDAEPMGEKGYMMDDDYDPIITELRMLNYRYVRLYFNQQTDKFIMFNGWVDPNWTDPRAVRVGIDSDEKGLREVVFGNNLIDIEQKSIPRLLVDEVRNVGFDVP
ncbi:hypothetical protein Brms1b_010927 [Colletotrichum noveboracense]|nr:hypothetical protein Brms1b_010927 [Colletotrichum noveboracense]